MSMIDHIRRSMKGEPSPPKLNEVKDSVRPVIRKASVSSIDARIQALIESKKINEITEAPLSKETTGAPVPTDNFSVKGKGKPKVMNANGIGPAEDDGQEQVVLGGVTPVDLNPETKDVTQKDLRKEGFLSSLAKSLAPKQPKHELSLAKLTNYLAPNQPAQTRKTVGGGLKAAGKLIAGKVGSHVASEAGKLVGISGSTITGTVKALASGGLKKSAKAAKSTTAMSASDKPSDDDHTPPSNPMNAGGKGKSGKSKKPPTVKGAVAGGGEPEHMTPDQFRKEQGLAPRGKAKPGTAPKSSTSKGASVMSKDSLFKQKSTNNDAHQTNFNKPMNKSKSSMSSKLHSRMMSSTASSPMSAKTSNPMSAKSSGVASLDKFKTANRMKIKKINEELSELVRLIEWQNRYKQPPAMNDRSAEEHMRLDG